MYILFSMIPATVLVVLGYFVLFSSTKTDGAAKTFGQILAIWIFILVNELLVERLALKA